MKLINSLFFLLCIFFSSNLLANIPLTIINNNKDATNETLIIEYLVCPTNEECKINNIKYIEFPNGGSESIPVTLDANEKLAIYSADIYYNYFYVGGTVFNINGITNTCFSKGNPITLYTNSSKISVTCQVN